MTEGILLYKLSIKTKKKKVWLCVEVSQIRTSIEYQNIRTYSKDKLVETCPTNFIIKAH